MVPAACRDGCSRANGPAGGGVPPDYESPPRGAQRFPQPRRPPRWAGACRAARQAPRSRR